MRRLHQQRGTQLDGKKATAGAAAVGGGGGGGGHKRRRRRRPKKITGGGSSATSATLASSSAGWTSTTSGTTTGASRLAATTPTTTKQHDAPLTKRDLYFALRCGMVQIGPAETAVGRVTLVNWDKEIVLDTFVKVPVPVLNYRTAATGITPESLKVATSLDAVRKKVASLIKGRILIGHGLEVDLGALRLRHPWCDVRDTATYAPYMQAAADSHTTIVDTSDHSLSSAGMLLPRTLDDLRLNELPADTHQEAVGQPILVAEAIACVSLYQKARTAWENWLVQRLQHQDRQREMMLSMRNAPVVLSRIAEDQSGDEHGYAASGHVYLPKVTAAAAAVAIDPRVYVRSEWNNEYFDTSTLASDTPTLDNYEAYNRDDDLTEARHVETEALHPLFENLHLLQPESSSHESDHQTVGSGTAPGSRVDEWTSIWNPLTAVSSVTNGDWTQESPAVMVATNPPHHLPVSLTEEELMDHLPAHLLDDIEKAGEEGEPKKKSWFGLGRRRRSSSLASAGEATFHELKVGTRVSLSDRTGRRSKGVVDETTLDSSTASKGSHGFFTRMSTKSPPGF